MRTLTLTPRVECAPTVQPGFPPARPFSLLGNKPRPYPSPLLLPRCFSLTQWVAPAQSTMKAPRNQVLQSIPHRRCPPPPKKAHAGTSNAHGIIESLQTNHTPLSHPSPSTRPETPTDSPTHTSLSRACRGVPPPFVLPAASLILCTFVCTIANPLPSVAFLPPPRPRPRPRSRGFHRVTAAWHCRTGERRLHRGVQHRQRRWE